MRRQRLDVIQSDGDNKSVKTAQFLHFWSLHNATIIEVLIGLILVSFIYLAFRTFFHEEAEPEQAASVGLNSSEIEKTLQKLIEAQNSQRVGPADVKSPEAAAGAEGGPSAAAVAAALSISGGAAALPAEEVQKFTQQIEEKEKIVLELKKQLEVTQKAQAEAKVNNPDFEKKLKDLESRLAEYEIISEDIADLSFYKEENIKLQKQLAALKNDGTANAIDAAAATASTTVVKESTTTTGSSGLVLGDKVAATDSTQVIAGGAAGPAATPIENSVIDKAIDSQAPKPAENTEAANAIDDELMKEFAMAVKDQNGSSEAAPQQEKVVVEDEKKLVENQNLMGEFENFVKKG
jgi:hypothetical protein